MIAYGELCIFNFLRALRGLLPSGFLNRKALARSGFELFKRLLT